MIAAMRIDAFVVLHEDRYETMHGDGYFAYYAAAFATRAEAEAFIQGAKLASPKAMVAYHLRTGTLTNESGTWTMTAALEGGERIDTNGDGVATDWAAVARRLGAL